MSNDYSENTLIQESTGKLLQDELGWEVEYAYNSEQLGKDGTFGRKSYKEILLVRYFREALKRLNPWITLTQIDEAQKKFFEEVPDFMSDFPVWRGRADLLKDRMYRKLLRRIKSYEEGLGR